MILIDVLKNPGIFETLSMGEKVQTVLWAVAIIVAVVFLVKVILNASRKSGGSASQGSAEAAPVDTSAGNAPSVAGTMADEALIAVIAAAIAAFEGTETANRLVVRKIRRIPGPDPIWSNLGRQESLDSRRV